MDFLVPCRHLVLLLVALGDGKGLLLVLGIKLIRFALEKNIIFKDKWVAGSLEKSDVSEKL